MGGAPPLLQSLFFLHFLHAAKWSSQPTYYYQQVRNLSYWMGEEPKIPPYDALHVQIVGAAVGMIGFASLLALRANCWGIVKALLKLQVWFSFAVAAITGYHLRYMDGGAWLLPLFGVHGVFFVLFSVAAVFAKPVKGCSTSPVSKKVATKQKHD